MTKTLAKLKISTNLFLGESELNRLTLWWKQNNAILKAMNSQSGIIKGFGTNEAGGFRITDGTTPDKITLQAGVALAYDATEEEFRVIYVPSAVTDVVSVPTDSSPYYVKIRWLKQPLEEGVCSVSASGQLTGVGTEFTAALRGQPSFPSKIAFEKTGLVNTSEYEVVQVISDTSVQLTGSFTVETGLSYKVVGTFTPDVVVAGGDKFIFEYNSYEIVVEASATVDNVTEFLLAMVSTDGVSMTISDYRSQWAKSKAEQELSEFDTDSNPVIGVEWAKYDSQYSARDFNLVKIGWGYRAESGNWTKSEPNRRITITSGSGGVFAAGDVVASGTFNGWRVYFGVSGKYVRIVSQVYSGGSVVLTLDHYSLAELPSATTNYIVVVPDCDKVAVRTTARTAIGDTKVEEDKVFPVHYGAGLIRIRPMGAKIEYRNIWNRHTTEWRSINDGDYIDESSWDDEGVIVTPSVSSVAGAEITLLLHPNAYGVAAVLNNTNNIMTALFSESIGTSTHIAGIIQATSPTKNTMLVTAAPADNIIGMFSAPTGTVVRVYFTNEVTLVHSLAWLLNGVNMTVPTLTPITFMSAGSGFWLMVSASSLPSIKQALWKMNTGGGATSDVLSLAVTNNSTSSKNCQLLANIAKAPNGSTLLFPPLLGMIAKYDDPSGSEQEAWQSFSISSSNFTGITFNSVTHARYKIIGKTCHISVGGLNVTLGSTTPVIPVHTLNINGRTFSPYIATGSGGGGAMGGLGVAAFDTLFASNNVLAIARLDGTDFTVATHILSFGITFELA